MSSCHTSPPTPSPLLAILCLTVVRRVRPEWVSISVADACRREAISWERASRLCSRALPLFESVVAGLTRIGRPRADLEATEERRDSVIAHALLEVASSILQHVKLHSDFSRNQILGAWERLHQAHSGLTLERFTAAVGIPQRTFREWRRRARMDRAPPDAPRSMSPNPQPVKKCRRRRRPRRPRFGFNVTIPDVQIAADTTDIGAFDVPLKLIAAQDVGGRDQDLLDAIIVDDRECADSVIQVLTQALGENAGGKQAITDQGTPYMAKATMNALDDLTVEHAPQREGDPLGKATIERAFRSVKDIARPILELTNQIARAVPILRRTDLAKAATTLLITALLRSYQAGSRASHRASEQRANVDAKTLEDLAERSRESARAHDSSARLLLQNLHDLYGFETSCAHFVNTFRRYPVPVLRDAERAFSAQAHRDDIRNRTAYFGFLVRRAWDSFAQTIARNRQSEQQHRALREQKEAHDAELERRHANPLRWLARALQLLALQWDQKDRKSVV